MRRGELVDKATDQCIELAKAAQCFAGNRARETGIARIEAMADVERRLQGAPLAQNLGQNLLRGLARLQPLRCAHAQGPGF